MWHTRYSWFTQWQPLGGSTRSLCLAPFIEKYILIRLCLCLQSRRNEFWTLPRQHTCVQLTSAVDQRYVDSFFFFVSVVLFVSSWSGQCWGADLSAFLLQRFREEGISFYFSLDGTHSLSLARLATNTQTERKTAWSLHPEMPVDLAFAPVLLGKYWFNWPGNTNMYFTIAT